MKKFLLIPVAIVLVAALVFGGCAKPAAEVPEEIRIGGVYSLTGPYSAFSTGGAVGVDAAVEDINSLGGIYLEDYGKRLPVRVIVTNSESDGLKAGTLAEDLILRDDVDFLIQGCTTAFLSTPIATVCERYQIPFVSSTGPLESWRALREAVTPPWKYTWAMSFAVATPAPAGSPWDKPGMSMADMALEWMKTIGPQTNKKAALYATDDPDGRGWMILLPGLLEAAGYDICGKEESLGLFVPGTTDFSAIIQEWIDCDCDILVGNAPGVDTGVLLRQSRSMGFKPKAAWCAKAAINYDDVVAWGGNLPQGICTDSWWAPSFDPELCTGIAGRTPQALADYWLEETGRPLNVAIGFGYNAAQVLFDSIERAGTIDDPDAVVNALEATDLQTICYRMQFDETQFGRVPMFLSQWRETDALEKWECPIVFAPLPHMGESAELIFPIPYD